MMAGIVLRYFEAVQSLTKEYQLADYVISCFVFYIRYRYYR